jgi:prephenate dehydratase
MKQLAILGPKGTFSDSACQKYLSVSDEILTPVYYHTIDDTFFAVGTECEYGIIPIENTLDGYVQRSLDLLLEKPMHIITDLTVPVQFSLSAKASSLSEIRRLYVQFKTKGQCLKLIHQLKDVKIITTESNMESLDCLQNGTEGDAAIIPHHIYQEGAYPFGIENVTDSTQNYTRFIVIEPKKSSRQNHLTTSIKASLSILDAADRPGELFRILKTFSEQHVNIVSIMSRPTKKSMGTYHFYLELNGNREDKKRIEETVQMISKTSNVQLFGIYSPLD